MVVQRQQNHKKKSSDNKDVDYLIEQISELIKCARSTDEKDESAELNEIVIEYNNLKTKYKDTDFYQFIFNEVSSARSEVRAISENYINDVGPMLKTVSTELPLITQRLAKIESDIDLLQKNRPKTFSEQVEEKAKTVTNVGSIFKAIAWILAIVYVLSTVFPRLYEIFRLSIGG